MFHHAALRLLFVRGAPDPAGHGQIVAHFFDSGLSSRAHKAMLRAAGGAEHRQAWSGCYAVRDGPSNSTATPCLVQEASSLITRAGLPLTVAGPARSSVSWRPALIAATVLGAGVVGIVALAHRGRG